jgi:hypothetical protein
MPRGYVGYTGVANSALTHPGNAEGTGAQTFFSDFAGDIGEGVAGATVIWREDAPDPILEEGYILMENSPSSDPLYYIEEENFSKIRLERF